MLSRLSRLVAIAALLASSGVPVAALQLAAWGRMTIAFARHDGLRLSLRKTFDGRHDCDLCARLGGARPNLSAPARPEPPLTFIFPASRPSAFFIPSRSRRIASAMEPSTDRSLPCDPPPPRSSLV